ncbi:MAG: hypothetical protein Q4Q22_06540 [Methanosphaera sp.]|nr:hypothetical protein [Methanosphaera sp.]
MSENKYISILATNKTKIYLLSYLAVLTLVFASPLMLLLFNVNLTLLGANLLFFELNMFLFLVLMVYTYVTRSENKNWKIYTYAFILSLCYLIATFLVFSSFK